MSHEFQLHLMDADHYRDNWNRLPSKLEHTRYQILEVVFNTLRDIFTDFDRLLFFHDVNTDTIRIPLTKDVVGEEASRALHSDRVLWTMLPHVLLQGGYHGVCLDTSGSTDHYTLRPIELVLPVPRLFEE